MPQQKPLDQIEKLGQGKASPACLRIFAQEPDPYLARLAKRMREHLLQEPLNPAGLESRQEEGSQPAAVFQVLGAKRAISTLGYVLQKAEAC